MRSHLIIGLLRLLSGLAIFSTLAGCADLAAPPETAMLRSRVLPPRAIPATRPTTAPATASAPAGRSLVPTGPISLPQAYRIALANNHTLRLAREDVGIAQQQVYVARSLFLPQVTAGYGYDIRDREVEVGFGAATFPTAEKEFQRAELKVQMTIWDFGRSLGKYEQAELGKQIADLQRRRMEQSVLYQTAKAYFNLLRAQKARTIAAEALKQALSHLQTARSFFRNGVVDKNDVLRAEVQVAEVRQQLITAENAVELARSVLNNVLGINVNHQTEVVDVTSAPKLRMSLAAALQRAVDCRPEFEVAQKGILQEEAGLTEARGEFLPRIYVSGSLNRLDDDYQVHKNSAIAELGITMDLFTGGRRTALYRIARQRRRKAVETAKQICDGIALEVKQALLGVEEARKRLSVAEKAVSQADENLRLIENKYKQTAATPTDVVDAETLRTRAHQNYYAALYDLITAVKRLEFAMGTITADGGKAHPPQPTATGASPVTGKEKAK